MQYSSSRFAGRIEPEPKLGKTFEGDHHLVAWRREMDTRVTPGRKLLAGEQWGSASSEVVCERDHAAERVAGG